MAFRFEKCKVSFLDMQGRAQKLDLKNLIAFDSYKTREKKLLGYRQSNDLFVFTTTDSKMIGAMSDRPNQGEDFLEILIREYNKCVGKN